MEDKKGLSQILYLIIAAAVLMVAALTLIFVLNDGLEGIIDFGADADAQACESQLDQLCATGAPNVETPSSCIVNGTGGTGRAISGVDDYNVQTGTTSCTGGGGPPLSPSP